MTVKIISWNLLRLTGASLNDIVRLIHREHPDLLLMQEGTHDIDGLFGKVGGEFFRDPLPGRIHGLGVWSPTKLARPPVVLPLQSGTMFDRVSQIIDLGAFSVANVHLSHGQLLTRRQWRPTPRVLPPQAAVLGDYN